MQGPVKSGEANNGEIAKILAVIGPLSVTTLAVTYDVGFFFGIGIGFFSFFSLPEHLVFALQSIPFFVPPVIIFSVWYASAVIGYRRGFASGSAFVAGLNKDDPTTAAKSIDAKLRRNRRLLLLTTVPSFILFVAAGAFFILKLHFYLVGALFIVLAALACLSWLHQFEYEDRSLLTKVGLVACGLGVTFAIGVQRADDVMNAKTATEAITVDEKSVPVKLIRGGDKGVLVLAVETKTIRFLRWDSIKDIRTVPTAN